MATGHAAHDADVLHITGDLAKLQLQQGAVSATAAAAAAAPRPPAAPLSHPAAGSRRHDDAEAAGAGDALAVTQSFVQVRF